VFRITCIARVLACYSSIDAASSGCIRPRHTRFIESFITIVFVWITRPTLASIRISRLQAISCLSQTPYRLIVHQGRYQVSNITWNKQPKACTPINTVQSSHRTKGALTFRRTVNAPKRPIAIQLHRTRSRILQTTPSTHSSLNGYTGAGCGVCAQYVPMSANSPSQFSQSS